MGRKKKEPIIITQDIMQVLFPSRRAEILAIYILILSKCFPKDLLQEFFFIKFVKKKRIYS